MEADLVALIRYEGQRDSLGYDVHLDDDPEHATTYWITPRGGVPLSLTIDGSDDSIFEEISKIGGLGTDQEVRELCDRYGHGYFSRADRFEAAEFKEKRTELVELLELAADKDWPSLEITAARMLNQHTKSGMSNALDFRRAPGNKNPRLIIVTRDLFTFAALQVCAAISEGQEIKQCPQCKGFFATGPNTGRKRDGVYCLAKCRVAAHRAKS